MRQAASRSAALLSLHRQKWGDCSPFLARGLGCGIQFAPARARCTAHQRPHRRRHRRKTPGGTCGSRCSRRLKVVLWQRDEKSANGRRKLFGVAAVAELVRQISHVPLRVIRPSSSMPWVEQVRLVRSADVIISAHSSGLVNVIFAHPATVVIELQAVHTDGTSLRKRPTFRTWLLDVLWASTRDHKRHC